MSLSSAYRAKFIVSIYEEDGVSRVSVDKNRQGRTGNLDPVAYPPDELKMLWKMFIGLKNDPKYKDAYDS